MSINQVFNQTTPQYSNLWELTIFPIHPRDMTPKALAQSFRMRFLAQSCTLPFMGFEMEKTNTGAAFPRSFTAESSFDVEFLETREFTVLDYFETWQNKIFDKEKRVWKTGNHRQVALLTFLQPAGVLPLGELGNLLPIGSSGGSSAVQEAQNVLNDTTPDWAPELQVNFQPSRVYLIEGLIPTNIGDISLDYTSSEQLRITVSFESNKITRPDVAGKLREQLAGGATDLLGGLMADVPGVGQWF